MMCGFVFGGDQKLIRELAWQPSDKYEFISLSLNPHEDFKLAAEKKQNLIEGLPEDLRAKARAGWHFLTAKEETSIALGKALGISFKYDKRDKQYAHPAASVVLSPEGKITRYLYGFEHRAQDVKLALLEATAGKIGTVADRILLFCYQYDPAGRTYSLVAMRLVQAGSTVMVLGISGFYFGIFRRVRRERKNSQKKEKTEGVRS
jgi:protein SCO1/2